VQIFTVLVYFAIVACPCLFSVVVSYLKYVRLLYDDLFGTVLGIEMR
jgi:hypothetical protein